MTSELDDLEGEIEQAMLADQHGLQRDAKQVRRRLQRGQPADRLAQRFQEQLTASRELSQWRADHLPAVTFDDGLPISARRDEIRAAIEANPVVVVCGETGSGKSTQLPKLCLEMGRGVRGMIGHTQPRRIAARSVASRLAEELGTRVGLDVGFKVRFTDETRRETYIKLMTDGILLAETRTDRFLQHYDTLIVDEAHERSLNIDFLLGYVKRLLPRRPELRVIITSATIDAERFAAHFGSEEKPAPVIEVSGRTFPVEMRYRPLEEDDDDSHQADLPQAVVQAVDELAAEGSGDVLVFLPTEREIRSVARTLRGHLTATGGSGQTEILPLYARLSVPEQAKVFQPHKGRRIVLATNVAESSLTVPGIRYVIDSGTARISRYAARSKVQRLPIEAVSRASADQRAGRCGRVAPGICIRLYEEDDYLSRDEYTTPEIRRTNLAAVILQTRSFQLGDIESFPFLDPPHPEAIRDGYRTLFELGALDEQRELTEIGRTLSHFPTDPRIGRMILAADEEGCLHEVLIIAAALEVQDPRDRPADRRQAADARHEQFAHESSDFLTYLNLWDFYWQLKNKLSRGQLRKALRDHFLSNVRMMEWLDVHRQLKQLVEQRGLKVGPRRDDAAAIHRALLSGLLANVALRGDRHEYTGGGGKKFYLWPGSAVFQSGPKWIMAGEVVETTRRYARTIARIDPPVDRTTRAASAQALVQRSALAKEKRRRDGE